MNSKMCKFSVVPRLHHRQVEQKKKQSCEDMDWHGVRKWWTGIAMAMDCQKLDKDLIYLNNEHTLSYMINILNINLDYVTRT